MEDFFIELVLTTNFVHLFLLKYIKKMFGKRLQIIKKLNFNYKLTWFKNN